MEQKRSSFSGRLGFVLAAAGSAVGLGNIWRFPYLAAQYGGGTFLLVYLILSVTFGFTLMVAEIAIGRKTGLSAIGAFQKLDKRYSFLGWLASLVPILIFPYYSVIGGWVIKYFVTFASGHVHDAASDAYFGNFTGTVKEPILWFVLFVILTAIVVFLGVEKGIEKVSKIMMPILVVLTVVIAVYGLTVDGAMAGVIYYLKPNMKDFSAKTILAAMGQMFYSMSLAMGIMVTYGSYMKKSDNLEKCVRNIEWFDTGIAFMAGLMIIPAVFAFSGGTTEKLQSGPSLMFVMLPKVFDSMPFGGLVGTVFFILVFFAALTSSISLMETIVSIFMDKLKWSRHLSCIVITLGSLAIGLPSSLGFSSWKNITFFGGMSILDTFDFISNSIIMPIVAFFTCVIVGFIIRPQAIADEVKATDGTFRSEKLFSVMIKWIAPIFLVLILGSSIATGLGVFTL